MFLAPDPDFLPEELKRLLLSAPVRQWLKYEGVSDDEPMRPERNENADDPRQEASL